jgi:hypothetical protein
LRAQRQLTNGCSGWYSRATAEPKRYIISQATQNVDIFAQYLLNKIEFAILQNVQYHYILWSTYFKIVNPKVMFTYIRYALDFPGKKANLRLAVLNIFGGYGKLTGVSY